MAVIWRAAHATVVSESSLLKSNDKRVPGSLGRLVFRVFQWEDSAVPGCGEDLTENGRVLRGDARVRDGAGHVSKSILTLLSPRTSNAMLLYTATLPSRWTTSHASSKYK